MGRIRRIVIAPNAFKGTLSAREAGEAMGRGILRGMPGVKIEVVPMADGGDGMMEAVVEATGGRIMRARVHDPLGRVIGSMWGLSGNGKMGVVGMSLASGLALLKASERNPMKTSTRGTGELIAQALSRGVEKLLVGIGGSATNDGAMGIARALGARFLDRRGKEIPEGGGELLSLENIDMRGLDPRLREVSVEVACDVDNPLCGRRGAAAVYGPQKGATPAMVKKLDAGLRRLAEVIERDMGKKVAKMPGAGAAGGSGAGLVAFLGARLRPGAEMVMEAVGLREKMAECDLVITGEGRLDRQTAHGKAPAAVARTAREVRGTGVPVIAICGSVSGEGLDWEKLGFRAVFSAMEEPMGDEDLKKRAAGMVERCALGVGRMLVLGGA